MKILLSICCIFFFFTANSQTALIDSIITRESLTYSISALANDSMQGRPTGTAEAKNAATFIAEQFQKAGLKPVAGNDHFFSYYPLKYSVGNKIIPVNAINVIGAIRGNESPDTSIIFSAHYDHLGLKKFIRKDTGDSIYNGANDNASGVSVIIELAKYYTALKNNRYTLLFIAFSGEELGLLGSDYTSKHLDLSHVKTVINFDMVGRPIKDRGDHCMVIAEFSDPIIKKLNARLPKENKFFIYDQYPEEDLYERSDHYSFKEVKTSFSIICSSPYDEYYHTVEDEIGTIDFDFLLNAAKKIAIACEIFIK